MKKKWPDAKRVREKFGKFGTIPDENAEIIADAWERLDELEGEIVRLKQRIDKLEQK